MSFFILLFMVIITQTAQCSYGEKFLSSVSRPLLQAPIPSLPLFPMDELLPDLQDSDAADNDAASAEDQNCVERHAHETSKRKRPAEHSTHNPKTFLQHCPICLELFANLEQVAPHIAHKHLGKKLKNMHHYSNQALLTRCVLQKIVQDGKEIPYEKEKIMKKCPNSPCKHVSNELSNARRHWATMHLLKTLPQTLPIKDRRKDTNYQIAASKLLPQSPMCDPARVGDFPKVVPKKEQRKNRDKQTQCSQCFRNFSTKRSCIRHYNMIHKNLRPSCGQCRKVLPNQESGIRHIIMVHLLHDEENKPLLPFVCSLQKCKTRVATKRQLAKHLLKYHGLRTSALPNLQEHKCTKSWQTLRKKAYAFLQKPSTSVSS